MLLFPHLVTVLVELHMASGHGKRFFEGLFLFPREKNHFRAEGPSGPEDSGVFSDDGLYFPAASPPLLFAEQAEKT